MKFMQLPSAAIFLRLIFTGLGGPSLALKPGAEITRSTKEGYQWSHKKD